MFALTEHFTVKSITICVELYLGTVKLWSVELSKVYCVIPHKIHHKKNEI